MDYLSALREQFNSQVSFHRVRPLITQIMTPLYHEDGDMVDIFLDELPDGSIRVCDHAMTLMRLSYDYEIDTDNKERILNQILSENAVDKNNGNLNIVCSPDALFATILHFAQTVAKIGNMRIYKREIIKSMFFDQLREYVFTELTPYSPSEHIYPLSDHDEYEVDFELRPGGVIPIYLYGVKDTAKSRLVTISCQAFQASSLHFQTCVVHEDFESLGKKDRKRITNAVDKQFTTLEDFIAAGPRYLRKLAEAV